MRTRGELEKRIAALEVAGQDASEERADLAKLVEMEKSLLEAAKARVTVPGAGEFIALDVEVDMDAFESGGQAFGAPTEPGVYSGTFQDIIIPKTKPDQRWFVFKTADPRLSNQVRSALIVTPGGAGAFKLNDILTNLAIPYSIQGNRIVGQIRKGMPCQLVYQEVVLEGKTQNRLQDVQSSTIESV